MSVNAFTQLRHSIALRMRPPSLRVTLMLIVPALVAVVGLFFYLVGGRYVSTDNAYVGAQKVLITPEVSGKVVRIAVIEGQLLSPGDELFSIDPEPYRFAAQEAEAKLARVRSDFGNLKSTYASLGKQIELARQSVAANQAEFNRKTSLLENRISTPSDLDKSRMALAAAKGLLEQLQQQEATVRNQLLGDIELPIETYPQFVEAAVALQRAKRDLANTVLRAPIAGIATQVTSIQMGRFLTAGMAVFSIIGSDSVWVDANPKETDLTYVRPGQSVAITVDAFPSRAWRGTVAAISPGTGAQFAILPPQNAAGNWIKIVQRVPVRIEFEAGQDLRRLRAGMSATVGIDTGRRGRLARLLGSSAVAQDPEQ
jgi:membrane fusion protein (multidrug efflux system)